MSGRRRYWVFMLCLLLLLVMSIGIWAEEQSGFVPVRVGKNPSETQSATVRVVLNKESVFFLEGRFFNDKLALPVLSLFQELQLKFKVEKDQLSLINPVTGDNVVLLFKENKLVIGKKQTAVVGWIGESDYYLNIGDLHYLIGVDPIWSPELQEISIEASWKLAASNSEGDVREDGDKPDQPVPFQPINRLNINMNGRGEGWSNTSSPGWDSGDLELDWETHGLVAGGSLVLGGKWIWQYEPENDLDYFFTTYRWEKDLSWGRFTLGTQTYVFWDTLPINWEMRGLSITDRKQWDQGNLSTNIVGLADKGDTAELWLNDNLMTTTPITSGKFAFEDIWLPQLKANNLIIVIKQKDQIIDRRSVEYISGERLLNSGEKRYIFAIGETKVINQNDYDSQIIGAGEWVQGIGSDLTLGGFLIAANDDVHRNQGGVNLAWRPKSNFIVKAETWTESPELAWRVSSDWGHDNLYIQSNYFHRDLGFNPIFPDNAEIGSKLNLAQLSLNWYSKDDVKGIVSGEYRREVNLDEDERFKLESSLDFRSGKWQGLGYASWLRESKTSHDDLKQGRLLFTLTWDFLPNQWLEGGVDFKRTWYQLSNDESKTDGWFRWTNQYLPKDRWLMEYDYTDDDYGYEQKIRGKWSHLCTNELTTFAGIGYGWGENVYGFNRWLLNCGLQYQLTNGLNIGFGYEWSVRQPEIGNNEYNQSFWLQISFGVLFGSGGPVIVPNTGEDKSSGVLTGVVYRDVNGNGMRDRNEPGVNGIQVVLDELYTVSTDAEGRYTIFNVAPGIHRVNIDPLNLPVLYNTAERYRSVYVVSGATIKEDLGLQVVAGVSGRVFIDDNGNGVYDLGETLLAGVRVRTEKETWATSGKNGVYYLQLIAGEHSLEIDPSSLPLGLQAVSPKKIQVGEQGEEVNGVDLPVRKTS